MEIFLNFIPDCVMAKSLDACTVHLMHITNYLTLKITYEKGLSNILFYINVMCRVFRTI